MAGNTENHIVWIDTELTGLDVENCHILELACIITDKNLKIVGEPFHVVIHQAPEVLKSMNKWCKEHHFASGLVTECTRSSINVKEAEEMLLQFLRKYKINPGTCPLAGNTAYMDRLFLKKYMPRVDEYLHYRIIDVSSIYELERRWISNNIAMGRAVKRNMHRALPDIYDSIRQLEHYKLNFFKSI